ncbi:hypothetical protein AcW1_005884 [Taiwanofungus camphoratus]|nr:hypothetical protein AcW2_004639 [Antrodia cinnamomea]KAI0934322.1 hypothetical protein AcV5_006200 [Antrodia cinnamomea]KAI0950391.1 hypothetical protein AcV7_008871 [Antrodia cinnamomea]KAI0957515.1 hypothetical protein AcW1_005884 [Antrodia cinnamomea]
MAYHDPYYGNQQYPPQQFPEDAFNPYANGQSHPTYDQGGYSYDNGGSGERYGGYRDDPSGAAKERDRSVFEGDDAVLARPQRPKTSRNIRQWRYDHQGNLWTRGSRAGCFGRFFCCTIMIVVFLVISILLSLALWARPPDVVVNEPTLASSNPVQLNSTGLTVDLDVDVNVNNPNYFSVDLSEIKAELFYPLNNTPIGGGEMNKIDFRSHTQTNFTFPMALQYNISADPGFNILIDLAKKCGIVPGTSASDVTVNYKITLGIRALFIPIKPVISNSFNFACPLDASDIEALLKAAGINLGNLGSLLF